MMNYIAFLHKDRKSDYGVSFPDFPGCITAGRTFEEAHRNALDALTLHIEGMRDDGDTIPRPSTLDHVEKHPGRPGATLFLVDIPVDEKTVRVNITARQSQIETIDRLAESAGMTRSAYIVRSAMKEIKRRGPSHAQTRR
jgi:predicted RNase H-like HicB family nuclease